MEELYHRLLSDLSNIGIPLDFSLELRPYSKTYFGRYDPNISKIVLYVYEDSDCTSLYPYRDLLNTAIHEAVHCIQWHDKNFIRLKGVMHDAQFYRLLDTYTSRADKLERRRNRSHAKLYPICRGKDIGVCNKCCS